MAKRRPIVDQNYNPVRSKLTEYRDSKEREDVVANVAAPVQKETASEPQKQVKTQQKSHPVEPILETPEPRVAERRIEPAPEQSTRPEVSPDAEVLVEKSFKTALTKELRARCTDEEHEGWHDFAYDVTGKRNNFSAVFRACLSLLEHATGELELRKADMKALKRPPKGQNLETALYEHQLGQIIYDAMRASGRPKDRVLARTEED
jgi:hypothetical protein